MSAAFEASHRGELGLAEQHCQEALDAGRTLAVPAPWRLPLDTSACVLRGQVANATGAWRECAQAFLEGADRARGHEFAAHRALWLGGAASALGLAGERDAAAPIATRGLELARANGMPGAIVFNLYALAQALADRAPERARALLSEALDLNTTLGYESGYELVGMTLVAARLADWPLTARLASRSIRHLHWTDDRPMLAGILNVSARALSETDPQAAAVIQGAARTLALAVSTAPPADTTPGNTGSRAGLILETRRATTRLLSETVGDDRLHELRDRGAAMDRDHAVAYTLSRLDEFLARGGG
jgi:hypothetical protein